MVVSFLLVYCTYICLGPKCMTWVSVPISVPCREGMFDMFGLLTHLTEKKNLMYIMAAVSLVIYVCIII